MTRMLWAGAAAAALAGAIALTPGEARACGGFFCGQQPVDQQAERIIFSVNGDGTVTMVVQIQYNGDADDFAWVLPLGSVPDVESLATFPQRALVGLDAQTGPAFQFPDDPECYDSWFLDAAAGGGPPRAEEDGGVTVHIRETVGPFEVVVIESDDPAELVSWLRTNSFRVTSAMEPYIGVYTSEGAKLLALRLQPGAEVSDIAPFMFTMPGDNPSIPLRLTALAAEPEMGIAVFILGDRRFGPAGDWADVEVDDSQIVWRPYSWPMETNWAALVAREVDEVDGRGFVTEFAGSTAPFLELLRASTPADEETQLATEALIDIMDDHPYLTRLYTRLSPEEMRSDPSFRRTDGGDIDRTRMLPRYVEGRDLCSVDWSRPGMADSTTPCDFSSCGAGSLCRVARRTGADGTVSEVAGCACVPGATARTTFDPQGRPIISCVDQRLSFLNPGDREAPGESPLPDPCVSFDCGFGGTCVSMNMTPTCVCARGLVAVADLAADGSRLTSCLSPSEAVPEELYDRTLPDLPAVLPGGRPSVVMPGYAVGGGACSASTVPVGAGSALAWLGLVALGGLFLVRRRKS